MPNYSDTQNAYESEQGYIINRKMSGVIGDGDIHGNSITLRTRCAVDIDVTTLVLATGERSDELKPFGLIDICKHLPALPALAAYALSQGSHGYGIADEPNVENVGDTFCLPFEAGSNIVTVGFIEAIHISPQDLLKIMTDRGGE